MRGTIIEQQRELLIRRKKLEAELRMHPDNLESRRSDRYAPSTSRENRAEARDEEDLSSQQLRSKGKRRVFDDTSAPEGNRAYYGSTSIATSFSRPE